MHKVKPISSPPIGSEYLDLSKTDLLENLINLTLYNNRRVNRNYLMGVYSTKTLKQLQKLYLKEYNKMKRRIKRNDKSIVRNRKQRQRQSRIDNLGILTPYYPWDFPMGLPYRTLLQQWCFCKPTYQKGTWLANEIPKPNWKR